MTRQYDRETLILGDRKFEMPFEIRQLIEADLLTFVLLSVPGSSDEVRNVYGYRGTEEIWQVESLNEKYPGRKNLPFESIRLTEDGLLGSDFYGRRYLIEPETGTIVAQLSSAR